MRKVHFGKPAYRSGSRVSKRIWNSSWINFLYSGSLTFRIGPVITASGGSSSGRVVLLARDPFSEMNIDEGCRGRSWNRHTWSAKQLRSSLKNQPQSYIPSLNWIRKARLGEEKQKYWFLRSPYTCTVSTLLKGAWVIFNLVYILRTIWPLNAV
jgi:hypothetical protein